MNYWTCWTALGDIRGLDGRLALIPSSHRLGGYEDAVREDLLPRGYSKHFEQASVWHTPTNIDMGDIILFNIKTIHAATRNGGEKFRLSLDTRITTCKGHKYLTDSGIKSLEAPAASNATTKKKATTDKQTPVSSESAGSITAFFGNKKKVIQQMA